MVKLEDLITRGASVVDVKSDGKLSSEEVEKLLLDSLPSELQSVVKGLSSADTADNGAALNRMSYTMLLEQQQLSAARQGSKVEGSSSVRTMSSSFRHKTEKWRGSILEQTLSPSWGGDSAGSNNTYVADSSVRKRMRMSKGKKSKRHVSRHVRLKAAKAKQALFKRSDFFH